MFKINDKEQAGKDTKSLKTTSERKQSKASRNQRWSYLLDACIIIAMGVILFWGISTQFPVQYNDATRYQCYAISFWQGEARLDALGLDANAKSQCAFLVKSSSKTLIQKMQERHFPAFLINIVATQPTAEAFHSLPPEYPLLTLVPFSLPLLAPLQWYQVVFAICMAIVAAIIFILLKRYRSTSAAIAFAIYLVLGSWATAEGRFDLIPAALTLGAIILAVRTKWKWAFALLALATLFKIYPVILILPFFIAQQMQSREKWFSWNRWSALAMFLGICVVVFAISFIFNVANTLYPFNYFENRPIEVESFPATLLWLGSHFGYPVQFTFQYQSLDYLSPLTNTVSLLSTLLLGVGLLYTFWLQWRGKIDLPMACLLTLLILIITGKVFSPQYLIWGAPLVAYVGKCNWKWLVSWGSVSILTTIIFPFIYYDQYYIQDHYVVILVRDLLIVALVCALLIHASRRSARHEFA
jgi:hypothetical protein